MIRRRTIAGVGAALVVATAACGSDGAGSGEAFSADVMGRLRADGVAPELVYVVSIPGHELAEQSVGVRGGEGFGATYVSPDGGQVELVVDWGGFSDEQCRDTPIVNAEPPGSAVTCEPDGAGWYRVGGGRHEYVTVRDDHVLRLGAAEGELDDVALRAALADARHVTTAGAQEQDHAPAPATVERADLPPSGDGAPDNSVGAGG